MYLQSLMLIRAVHPNTDPRVGLCGGVPNFRCEGPNPAAMDQALQSKSSIR